MGPVDTVETDSRVSQLLQRAARYKFLAAAFDYPGPSVLSELSDGRWRDPEQDPESLRRALASFRSACAQADLASLQEEYSVLFDRQVRCSPYESSYGDGRRLAGKPAELADIAGFYAAFGLELSRSHPEMPDHIAVELTFMSTLCLKEAYALFHGLGEGREVTREAQRGFIGAHLGRWVGAFAEGVEGAAQGAFFKAAAALLREFVALECRTLGVVPSPLGQVVVTGEPDGIACPFATPCEESSGVPGGERVRRPLPT
jgi:DMSO reductase family type II enzyme chaperone